MYKMYKMEPIGINRANRDQGSSHLPNPLDLPSPPNIYLDMLGVYFV